MVLQYENKTNFISWDGFGQVCIVSANIPDNPRIYYIRTDIGSTRALFYVLLF